MKQAEAISFEYLKDLANAAALDVSHWHALAKAIRDFVPEVKVFVHFTDTQTVRSFPALAEGIGDDFLSAYVDHYDSVNPWTAINLKSPIMAPIWTESSGPTTAANIKETEFYQDFLRHLGESDSATGIKLAHDDNRFAQLSLHYDSIRAERTHNKVAPLLLALAPTLQQSIRSLRLKQLTREKDRLGSFLETLADPAFVLDHTGKVNAINKAAERLIEQTTAIRIGAHEVLHIDDATAAAFVESARLGLAPDKAGQYASARPEAFLRTPAGDFSLTALRIRANLSGSWGVYEHWTQAPALILSLRPVTIDPRHQIMLLRQLFDLTAAEADLAFLLASGLSLSQAAARRGVTYETARWQLKSVFAKTKVRRQSELVSTLMRYMAPSSML
jgi:DNA-binding CsgD family transcriptional regulator/PAS domain-containing protein